MPYIISSAVSNFGVMENDLSRELRYKQIMDLKISLENAINFELLPLKHELQLHRSKNELNRYNEIKSAMKPIEEKVVAHFNELLRLRNEFNAEFKA